MPSRGNAVIVSGDRYELEYAYIAQRRVDQRPELRAVVDVIGNVKPRHVVSIRDEMTNEPDIEVEAARRLGG